MRNLLLLFVSVNLFVFVYIVVVVFFFCRDQNEDTIYAWFLYTKTQLPSNPSNNTTNL